MGWKQGMIAQESQEEYKKSSLFNTGRTEHKMTFECHKIEWMIMNDHWIRTKSEDKEQIEFRKLPVSYTDNSSHLNAKFEKQSKIT